MFYKSTIPKVLLFVLFLLLLLIPGAAFADTDVQEVDLIAGQHYDAGGVQIWNDHQYLYVKYCLQDGWQLQALQLAVAESLGEIPQTKTGNPIPGKFEYKDCFAPAVSEVLYTIPRENWPAGTCLFIAAHGETSLLAAEIEQQESAWAEGTPFPGKNWATYFTYVMQNIAPVADAGGPYAANEGAPVLFNGSNSYDLDGTIISYSWDFGDGTSGECANPTHTYSLPGEYSVTLTVTDDLGKTHFAETTAAINALPVADGTGPEAYNSDRNTPVTLYCDHSYDSDGTIVLYEWDFTGDGIYDWSSATPAPVSRLYPVAETYYPMLRVTDEKGATDCTAVTVRIFYFFDNFNSNTLDTAKWSKDVTGAYNNVVISNQEANFIICRSGMGHTFLKSSILHITSWNTITVEGKWKFYSPLFHATPEMTLYFYNADTNQLNGVAYDNWNSKIRYWSSNTSSVQYTRSSPKQYATFKLVIKKTSMEYWENGTKLVEIPTTALSTATHFQLKIGGWDASTISSNQCVYFDDIKIDATY